MSGAHIGGAPWQPPLLEERRPRRHEEAALQRSVYQFLRWALPADAVCFAVPNGLMRSRKTREIAAGQGVKAGIPDLCIIWRGHALFVELKAKRGTLSAVQRQMMEKLRACGAQVFCCREVLDVEAVLRDAGLPLTATAIGWRPHSRAYEETATWEGEDNAT